MTRVSASCSFVIFLLAGCQQPAPEAARPRGASPPEEAKATIPKAEVKDAKDPRLAAARTAQAELAGTLMKTLQAAVGEGDWEAGIQACKAAAPSLTRQVATGHEVELGRTSFRVRNPENAPRPWAEPHVRARVEKEIVEQAEDGTLRLLSPIRMKAPCLKCHGGADDIPEAVREALAANYPQDQATGFAEGELRGYFWVEVPASKAP